MENKQGPIEPVVSTGSDHGGHNYGDEKVSTGHRRSSVNAEVLQGEIFDERYETTHRGLKSRHAQMIALGGTIGTGLFVGSGQTLARGGPAFILGSYCFMSFLIFCVVSGIVEVAAYLPTPGSSMNLFGYRYVSKSLGFAMAGLVIEYWNPPVNIAVWITIMIVVIVGLNVLPVKFYGETEFWFAGTKVIMMTALLILSFILFWGGGPDRDRLGFRYWKDPGAANTYLASGDTGRFLALLSTFVLSAFPFTFAPELLIATGGEMQSPRRNLPIAARRYIYRLIFFYIGSVLAISVTCPSNDPALTSGDKGAGASAFVVGIKNAGIPVLDSIINAGIILSAWSSGNSFLYLSSRSLYSLALSGNAPKIFKTCSKSGVPYWAVAASSLFCALAYLNVASSGAIVFNWFVNLTNTSGFISWICCGIVYLRFRKAREAQQIPLSSLPYKNKFGRAGAIISITGFVFLLLINGFNVFWPQNWNASSFLTAYVGIPIFLVIYFGHRVYSWSEPWMYPPLEVDLQTGMDRVLEEETPPKSTDGEAWYMKVKRVWS
ncbi:unnamed protein product [Periconia digitata]|uniref:Amino acid permease/ SLC12A domain-containing protein n=1 Tax=Periconia digitata TaxID=1303443 RepID=A0A9W4XRH4_9PLEO|nr:unnamed protein product [Periconia digitata]